jgi:orotate phosphoribosyltransferase
MEGFNQEEFNRFIEKNNVYGFFKDAITLKSGRKSHFYANWRNVVEDVWLTEKVAEFVISYVESINLAVDTFYGVPEGATKLGLITQFEWARRFANYGNGSHALAMGRAKPKDHGAPKDRYFVGMPRGNCVVIEDVTTTGGSLLHTLEGLTEASVHVSGVISLTNRMEKRDDGLSVEEAVKNKGFPFYSMSSALDLLPVMYKKLNPDDSIAKAIEEEFRTYGVRELKLRS